MGKIGFVGISHLSLNYAAASLEKGFEVVCYDPDMERVNLADSLALDYSEPDLKQTLQKHKHNITFSSREDILAECDILYISKDVPTDDCGNSDLSEIQKLIDTAIAKAKAGACLVVLCQVHPGFTRSINYPKELLFYHVETLIFGNALDRALNPERIIIGMASPEKQMPLFLEQYLNSFNCKVLKMLYESAELTKISINLFLVSSVVTTNIISEMCEKIGADWFEIKEALKLDKRIGEHAYLTPGLGIAGGNLERDLNSTRKISYKYGVKNEVIKHWQEDCSYRRDWVLRTLFNQVLPRFKQSSIGILGIAYKENTSSIKNSPSINLMQNLQGYKIIAFDPVVKKIPLENIHLCDSIEEVLSAEILLVMTPWSEFKSIAVEKLNGIKVLIDPFNCYRNMANKIPAEYYSIGRGQQIAA